MTDADDELQRLREKLELIEKSLDQTQGSLNLTIQGMIGGLQQLDRVERNTQILIDQGKSICARVTKMEERLDKMDNQQ